MDYDNLNFGDGSSEANIAKEIADWLPKPGDRMFVASDTGVRLDPLGFSAYGGPRELTGRWQLYSGGFLSAGDRLVESCTGLPHEDELIYPIVNLYRHHLELELKYVLRCCPGCTEELKKWLIGTHSLGTLWNKIAETYPRFGQWASPECTEASRHLILEFDVHDPKSQAGRYPVDQQGNQTLVRLEIVDLPTFKLGVHKISHFLGTIIEQIGEDREWEAEMNSW
jgi:hypothetical protein